MHSAQPKAAQMLGTLAKAIVALQPITQGPLSANAASSGAFEAQCRIAPRNELHSS